MKSNIVESGIQPFKVFLILWVGQFMSIIGAGMTSFGIGVWLYQETGSVTLFSISMLFSMLPAFLLRPFGGWLADRYDRRWLMIIGSTIQLFPMVFMAVIYFSGTLSWSIVLPVVATATIGSAIQYPAYQATITRMVDTKYWPQASALAQTAGSAQFLISPFIAGLLFESVGLGGLVIFDVVSYLISLFIMWSLRHRMQIASTTHAPHIKGHWEVVLELRKSKPGLFRLFFILFIANLSIGCLVVLIGPLILNSHSPAMYGLGQSISASGMLISSVLMAIFGVPFKFIVALGSGFMCLGLSFTGIALFNDFVPLVASCFIFFLSIPIVNTSVETVIRKIVEPSLHGKIFAVLANFVQLGLIIAYTMAGPLVDRLFDPLVAEPGSSVLTKIVGYGKGRGIALLFLIMALVLIFFGVVISLTKHLRSLDQDNYKESME